MPATEMRTELEVFSVNADDFRRDKICDYASEHGECLETDYSLSGPAKRVACRFFACMRSEEEGCVFYSVKYNNVVLLYFALGWGSIQVAKNKFECAKQAKDAYSKHNKELLDRLLQNAQNKNVFVRIEDVCAVNDKDNDKDNEWNQSLDENSIGNAVVLKYFWKNASATADTCWKEYRQNKYGWSDDMGKLKVGRTIFEEVIVDTVQEFSQTKDNVKYIYLFAADSEVDGRLVSYYKALYFKGSVRYDAPRSAEDQDCLFLYNEIDTLVRNKESYPDSISEWPGRK